MSKRPLKPEDRFWKFVRKTRTCWIWEGERSEKGYGKFYFEKRSRSAHRWIFTNEFGPIPAGLCVLHRCDVPGCVNPKHLFLGTIADNNADMLQKGRQSNQKKKFCKYGHPFSGYNLRIRKRKPPSTAVYRACKICASNMVKKYLGYKYD